MYQFSCNKNTKKYKKNNEKAVKEVESSSWEEFGKNPIIEEYL